jgi:hypothetical protein
LKKRHELFLAAVFAVALQLGLIAIAVVTVLHGPTRASLSEPKVYGVPCYVAGSFLLSLGMGICSLAIEQSSVEFSWTTEVEKEKPTSSHNESKRGLDVCPRLIWLQQGQTVNDQTFEPYAILAGPKRYIVSSSRIEDAKRWTQKRSTGSSSDDDSFDPNHVQVRLGHHLCPTPAWRAHTHSTTGAQVRRQKNLGVCQCLWRLCSRARVHRPVYGPPRPPLS